MNEVPAFSVLVWFWCALISASYVSMKLKNKNDKARWYDPVLGFPVLLHIKLLWIPVNIYRWWYIHKPWGVRKARGRVEHCELTWGAGGNQWTTINGIKFATYWNILNKDWITGQVVTFEFYWDDLHVGRNVYRHVLHAREIHGMRDINLKIENEYPWIK